MNQAQAEESVEALIDDLKFIMGVRPHSDWPAMAEAALEHHDPRIKDHLLCWQSRRLQRAAHLSLNGLVDGDAEQIRAGFLDIRTIESLSDAPPPAAPTPPSAHDPAEPRPQQPIPEPRAVPEPQAAPESTLFPESTRLP